jgi:signal transduction histidine kinase/CheY-like chemotaxis protein
LPTLRAFPDAIATAGASAAFDRLARDVVVRVGIAGAALVATVIYLVLTLDALGAAGPIELLYTTLTTATAIGAYCALAPLVRRERQLRTAISRLEERIEALKQSEERARSLLEVQDDLIVRRDQNGRITDANDAFCALVGRRRQDLIGNTCSFGLPIGAVVARGDGTRSFDQKLTTEAKPRWFTWRQVPVRSSAGDRMETQYVGRDVTDRVRAEHAIVSARDQADAANRAKSQFLSTASDQIRKPMSSILAIAGRVLDSSLTSEQAAEVRAIKTSAEALLALVEEIGDFSEIDAGKLGLDVRPFALATLVEDAVAFLSPRALAKGIEMASFVDERLPSEVVGDAARLQQVLLDALDDAIQSESKSGVALIVEPGICPDEVCFSARYAGVDASAEAQGPTFETLFTFALTLPPAQTVGLTLAPPDLTNKPVLIAAPERPEAQLIARRLAAWGARVCTVADPLVAGALLSERPWDTIIVDRALGSAAAETIVRACGRATGRRLALIAPADRNELPALKGAGFTGYLVKPVRGTSLAVRFDAKQARLEEDNGAHRAQSIASDAIASPLACESNITVLLAHAAKQIRELYG